MKTITRLLPTILIPLLITSCGVQSGSRSGVKEYNISVVPSHNLDTAPGFLDGSEPIPRAAFPAKVVSSSISGGITTATLQLQPASDEWKVNGRIINPATGRVIPHPSQITVSSKKLSPVFLENMESVEIAIAGRHKGKVCMLNLSEDIHAIELRPLDSGKTLLTAKNPKTGKIYTVTLDRARQDDGAKLGHMSAANGNSGKIYFSDGQTSVSLDSQGWVLWVGPAGPGGSDYSYLETNSARGEFD